MYMNSSMQRGLAIGGASLVAVVALIGWTRHESSVSAQPYANTAVPAYSNPDPAYNSSYAPGSQAAAYPDQSGAPVVYGTSPFGTAPANRSAAPPAAAPEPLANTSAPLQDVAVRSTRTRARTRYVTRVPRRRVIVKRRSTKNSALIIGGSAAGGAAIGALAGGGKGAGIGALAGGAGGLVYDRLTHKKRVVVER